MEKEMTDNVTPITQAENSTKNEKYFAEIFPGPQSEVNPDFARLIQRLEAKLGMPIWLLIQNGDGQYSTIDVEVFKAFQKASTKIAVDAPICLLIDSAGGQADCAYRIARLFQRRTKNFHVLVPQYAKSAATLLALGGANIHLGVDAELGPLDVQMFDADREGYDSALNAIQSLERLNAFALTAFDQSMLLLAQRTAKKTETLVPMALEYAANIVRPLMEKIDTVDFTKKSRELKVAEEYAIRLMRRNYAVPIAKRIAGWLVEKYPTHGFVIDADECESFERIDGSNNFGLGLNVSRCSGEVDDIIVELSTFLDNAIYIGRISSA